MKWTHKFVEEMSSPMTWVEAGVVQAGEVAKDSIPGYSVLASGYDELSDSLSKSFLSLAPFPEAQSTLFSTLEDADMNAIKYQVLEASSEALHVVGKYVPWMALGVNAVAQLSQDCSRRTMLEVTGETIGGVVSIGLDAPITGVFTATGSVPGFIAGVAVSVGITSAFMSNGKVAGDSVDDWLNSQMKL